MNTVIKLKHLGRDSWSRPVYMDGDGRLWKDVDPRTYRPPELCTAMHNEFDGEPVTPIDYMQKYKGAQVEFIPRRDTWEW